MIVITPICSHALNTSSIVLSADDLIEVEVCEGRYGRQEQVLFALTVQNRQLLSREKEFVLSGRLIRQN